MNAAIAAGEHGITEVELVRASADRSSGQELLQAIEQEARSLAAEPGFVAASLHLSDDLTVVACLQWDDERSAKTARARASHPEHAPVEQPGEVDLAAYDVAYVQARDGNRIEIQPESGVATLIDVMAVDPDRQAELLKFNIANSDGFSKEPGFRSTSVLRGRDGTRIATYSQWDRVEDWIAAVRARAGESLPALEHAETVQEVNAALLEPGRQIGAVPEYHAYRVTAVIGG
jgi:heme-degrading monooxygenase HmoA